MDDLAHAWRALASPTRRRLLAATSDVDVVYANTPVGWTTVRPADGFRARAVVSTRGEGRIGVELREPLLVGSVTEVSPYSTEAFTSGGLASRYVGRHDLIWSQPTGASPPPAPCRTVPGTSGSRRTT